MRICPAQASKASFRSQGHSTWLSVGRLASAAAIAIGLFLFPRAGYAYVDPGSGSMFLQLLLASLLGALYTLKMYWRKIRSWLTGSKPANPPPSQEPPVESQDP